MGQWVKCKLEDQSSMPRALVKAESGGLGSGTPKVDWLSTTIADQCALGLTERPYFSTVESD